MPVTKEKRTPTEKQLAARAKFAGLHRKEVAEGDTIPYLPPYQEHQQTPKHMEQKEATVAEIRPFRTKKGTLVVDEGKMYEFELVTKREASRPLDKITLLPIGTGFQPSFSIPNRASAFNKTTEKFENWRYIEGQSSCWVSEQPELDEYEPKEIDRLLGNPENDLEFRDGRMLVPGGETGKLRLQAMFLSDYFVDNEKPRVKRPVIHQFKLNNPDAVVEEGNDIEDLAFRTMTQARNCTVMEMLAVSSLMGINIEDTSPAGINRIKYAFLSKAKHDPRNPKGLEQFLEIINNPHTKIKYLINQGLFRGILSTIQQHGKLTWAKLNAPILDLKGTLQPADELTARWVDKEQVVMDLLKELEAQIK